MYETIEQLEAGISAYRKTKRRSLNRRANVGNDGEGDVGDTYNLVYDVPDDAWEMWKDMPDDPRTLPEFGVKKASEEYPDRDLADIIEEAAENREIVDLESGTYELKAENLPIEIDPGEVLGIVGHESEPATITYNEIKRGGIYFFSSDNEAIDTGFVYNVVFDIDDEAPGDLTPDAGILRIFIEDEFWAHNVVVEGERKRWQYLDENDDAPSEIGGYYTWLVDVVSADGRAFHHRVKIDGGAKLEPAKLPERGSGDDEDAALKKQNPKFGQGTPFANAHEHIGTAVYKECSGSHYPGAGFYLGNKHDGEYDGDNPSPESASYVSQNVLWDCECLNCSMRLGENDRIVGGRVVYDDYWPNEAEMIADVTDWSLRQCRSGLQGQSLVIEEGSDVKVIGLSIDTDYYSNVIQIRNRMEQIELDRVVMRTGWLDWVDTDSNDSAPVRFSSKPDSADGRPDWLSSMRQVKITDCYWYDTYDSRDWTAYQIQRADVIGDGWKFFTEQSSDEVYVREDGSLEVDSESYASGTTHSASDLGVDDPRPLPEFDFDYSDRE